MLSDYKRYLLKIRNSLIRSGVELEVKDAQDYEEIFYLGEMLSDLLWFYSVLEISGSEDKLRGFMFPLNSHYKNSLRDKYFEDYLIYRAEYMEISASDAILRDKLQENKDEKVVTPMPSTLDFIKTIQARNNEIVEDNEKVDFGNWGSSDEIDYLEDDDFISYDNNEEEEFKNNESGYNTNSDDLEYDDDFVNYGSSEGEDVNFVKSGNNDEVDDDDDFVNYGTTEEVEENSLDGDEKDFGSWGNYEVEEEEEAFSSWGSSEDYEDSFIEETSSIEYEEEEAFGNWGSSDEEEEFANISREEEEDEFLSWGDHNNSEEDEFEKWGNSDENEEDFAPWGSSDNSEETEEDDFGSWGSSDDYQEAEEEFDDEEAFSSWGSSDDGEDVEENQLFEEDEDDAFGSWGSSEESSTDSDDYNGSDFGSWGESLNTSKSSMSSSANDKSPSSKKSKLDYEIESNEKTAKMIEKIALGIFGKGNILKSKISEKIKNMDENQD